MSTFKDDAPAYRCHKVVHALRIAKVVLEIAGKWDSNARIEFDNRDYVLPNRLWMDRHRPFAGDYYVIYDRGTPREYVSVSPAAQFEAGYTREPAGLPPWFPLHLYEQRELANCVAAMRWLEGYNESQAAEADAVNDPRDGVNLNDCIRSHEARAKLFDAAAIAAQAEADREAGITPWEPLTAEQRREDKKLWRTEHNTLQARTGKSLFGMSTMERYVIMLWSDEPLETRMAGHGIFETRSQRSVQISVRDDRYVVEPASEPGFEFFMRMT